MTWRRLAVMADSRQRANWSPISPVLVMISNHLRDTTLHPDPIKDMQAFNPFAKPEDRPAEEKAINVDFVNMRWIMGG